MPKMCFWLDAADESLLIEVNLSSSFYCKRKRVYYCIQNRLMISFFLVEKRPVTALVADAVGDSSCGLRRVALCVAQVLQTHWWIFGCHCWTDLYHRHLDASGIFGMPWICDHFFGFWESGRTLGIFGRCQEVVGSQQHHHAPPTFVSAAHCQCVSLSQNDEIVSMAKRPHWLINND